MSQSTYTPGYNNTDSGGYGAFSHWGNAGKLVYSSYWYRGTADANSVKCGGFKTEYEYGASNTAIVADLFTHEGVRIIAHEHKYNVLYLDSIGISFL